MSIASSAIVSIGMDGVVRVEATGVVFPNGMVITPDCKALIVGETFEGRLTEQRVKLVNASLAVSELSPLPALWLSTKLFDGLLQLHNGGDSISGTDQVQPWSRTEVIGPDMKEYSYEYKDSELYKSRPHAAGVEGPRASFDVKLPACRALQQTDVKTTLRQH
ncbi:hypothetical protein DVH05_008672 [Phytophthora capsici]|nr:hypothetical protein DVH05_008672 [Phytophthora capsici]